ncbi:unnamed protein product [Lactuca saligna]|uniref:Uncharacterized protein n=1 Tax=Lactuca saligna TaxID=75948 RepID=A0AA35UZB9_LACSI|nr:unnamed protein product [Lactuca saligna]CAI9281961.1 unnamed protein product [Lactuca saligna]
MTVNEVNLKTLLSERKRLFEEHEKLVTATNSNMEASLNEVKEFKSFLLTDNTIHNSKFIDTVNNLASHYDIEAKMEDIIASKVAKFTLLKDELMIVKTKLIKKDNELLIVKGKTFEINKSLVKIVEEKDAPYVDYISQILDATFNSYFQSYHLLMVF